MTDWKWCEDCGKRYLGNCSCKTNDSPDSMDCVDPGCPSCNTPEEVAAWNQVPPAPAPDSPAEQEKVWIDVLEYNEISIFINGMLIWGPEHDGREKVLLGIHVDRVKIDEALNNGPLAAPAEEPGRVEEIREYVERAETPSWQKSLSGAERQWVAYCRILLSHIDSQAQTIARKDAVIRDCIEGMDDLIAESHGVDGLHLNGEVATWEELGPQGDFGEWLEWLTKAKLFLTAHDSGGSHE